MSAPEPVDDSSASAPAGAEPVRYRLVVGSAAEAVKLVRERFGEHARVTSVRQIEAGGLRRFLQKPRLEVIVEVGVAPAVPAAPAPVSLSASAPAAAGEHPSEPSAREHVADTPAARVEAAPQTSETASPTRAEREPGLWRATGIDEVLLMRLRAENPGTDWAALPAPEALARLGAWLRSRYDAIPRRPAGNRRVFFGGCGVGKTTALCKALALDVFVRGLPVAVLKLDGDQPNASDGLAAFCDVLGAPLLRAPSEVEEFDAGTRLYLDVPGVGLDARAEQVRLAQTLDALQVDTRVLVVNATCEAEVIHDTWELGRACGATHVVFSHGDEVRRPGKLWRFVLNGGLRPLFLSAGPSPAGEIEEDVFGALLARTFPPSLARAAAVVSRVTATP